MNLDDSFTEKLQKRRKARKDYLKVRMVGSCARRKSNTLIEERQIPDENNNEYMDSLKCPYVEEMTLEHKLEKDDPIEEVKENLSFQQPEMEENDHIKEDKLTEEKVSLRESYPVVLRKEHSAQDALGERNMSQGTEKINEPPTYLVSSKSRGLYSTRDRLACLAAVINGWEDNLTRPAISATSSTKKAPAAIFKEVEDTLNSSFEPSNLPLSARKAIFEQAAMENLMAADIYDWEDNLTPPAGSSTPNTKNGWEDNLLQPAVHTTLFTKETDSSVVDELEDTLNSSFEPSKLPMSERKSIFEQAPDINGWKDNLVQSFVPATSRAKKTPVAAAKKVDDILNCSFEPSNLPLSERKAIFEQAAVRNKAQSEKQTFKSKGSVGRRSAMFEKSPKNKFRFRTPHQKPTNTSPVNPSTNVGNTLKSLTALRPRKPSLLKGNPTKPSAASNRSPTNPSTGSSTASIRRPTNPSIASTRSPINVSIASTRSPSKPSIALKRNPASPSVSAKRNPANPSTGRSVRQSATLSRSSSKSSVTSTKSPVRLTSTLTRGPSKPSTALTTTPIHSSAALAKSFSKLSIAPTKNTAGPSAAITRSPANSSPASAGSPAFSRPSPAKPGTTGRYTSSPTKSSTLKPPSSPSQQQWAKNTGAKPKIKQPLSSLVNHWEKLSSSTRCTTSQLEEEVPFHVINDREEESYLSEEQQFDRTDSEYEEDPTESEYEEIQQVQSECGEWTLSESEETTSYLTANEEEYDDSFTDISSFNSKKFKAAAGIETETETQTDEDRNNLYDCYSIDPFSDGDYCKPSRNLTNSPYGRADRENRSTHQPLLHSVSVYRKQMKESRVPPVRQERVSPSYGKEQGIITDIRETFKCLQEEVVRQKHRIGQSHQLINYLTSTRPEFRGSIEEAEAEKLLLTATQKHQACLYEIQRLKSQRIYAEDENGTLTITNMKLPLKRNFVAAQLERKNCDVHYFMCLVHHRAQMIGTQVVSTDNESAVGSLRFTDEIKLKNLPPDFSVVFEILTLQPKKESLYGIRRDQSKIRQSLRRKKGNGKPPDGSPGGPLAVRSPRFKTAAYTCFTLQNCTERRFTLIDTPFTSPLEGILKVSMQFHAEHNVTEKGFLTMFRDVSGFGAWYRRWCSLENHLLSYWMYPDDEESRKEVMGFIDLRQCTTKEVGLVSRDVCARPHTFQLVEVRPRQKGDRDTLISHCHGNLVTTKHLLSADTREEQERWCQRLNDVLRHIHLWNTKI